MKQNRVCHSLPPIWMLLLIVVLHSHAFRYFILNIFNEACTVSFDKQMYTCLHFTLNIIHLTRTQSPISCACIYCCVKIIDHYPCIITHPHFIQIDPFSFVQHFSYQIIIISASVLIVFITSFREGVHCNFKMKPRLNQKFNCCFLFLNVKWMRWTRAQCK